MTRYIEILAVQRPFAFNTDANGRTLFSVNFNALGRAPVVSFEKEIAKVISDAGHGTLNVDLFIGPLAPIPIGDGPYTTIINTGGVIPDETHNGGRYERLSFQLVIRALSYEIADARALNIWRTLDGKRNIDVAA